MGLDLGMGIDSVPGSPGRQPVDLESPVGPEVAAR